MSYQTLQSLPAYLVVVVPGGLSTHIEFQPVYIYYASFLCVYYDGWVTLEAMN